MRYVAVIVLVGCLGAGCASADNQEPTPWVHILKRSDVVGIDPITRQPAATTDGKTLTEEEIVDMTLMTIVKQHELVTKLKVLDLYFQSATRLSGSQRRNPDRTFAEWPEEDQPTYYRASAIVIAAIKELNPDLSFNLLKPGLQIVLPDPSIF
jgi:hypothetical protein